MHRHAWLALPIAMLLSGCGAAASDDRALVVEYSPDFQAAVAVEYDTLAVSCQRGDPATPPGCSPVKTMVNDYLQLRDQLRVD